MIAYKFKLYSNKHNAELSQLLREACFVWNHCLALQKRYYAIYKQFVNSARMELDRIHEKVTNSRRDWQWKLAHELCRKYDNIFIEGLSLTGMSRRWGRKMSDLAHGEFVNILQQVAEKYGCLVHKIDRFYASSKLCECGYKNEGLKLSDREWVCPECGKVHDRDINAARNILRRGIDELKSDSKTVSATADGQSRLDSRIPLL